MKRSRLRVGSRRATTDLEAARAWREAVIKASDRKCMACGATFGLQAHHICSQDVLKRDFPHGVVKRDGMFVRASLRAQDPGEEFRSLQQILWDSRNGVAACRSCHARHENAFRRMPLDRIPLAAVEFAREYGVQHRLTDRFYGRPNTNEGAS